MRIVYILICADSTLYTGITTHLARRVVEHNTSPLGAKYTKARRPVTLARFQEVQDRSCATLLERFIKKKTKVQKQDIITAKIVFSFDGEGNIIE